MDRRETLLTLMVLGAVPLGVRAQQATKVWRIGMLENSSMTRNAANLGAFVRGMLDLGYVEKKHFMIDYRSAEGRNERFPALVEEMTRGKVDVVVARGTPATMAASKAVGSLLVVTTGTATPRLFAASLARPGGNVTGLVSQQIELTPKRVEVLRDMKLKIARIAAIFNTSNPASLEASQAFEASMQRMGIQALLLDARRDADLERAIESAVKQRADALLVAQEGFLQNNPNRVIALAAKHRLPAIYPDGDYVDLGGLASYGINYPDLYYRAASFVDKILKGAKPADLAMEQATKFDLVINLKTARSLGIAIPQDLLARAARVVE